MVTRRQHSHRNLNSSGCDILICPSAALPYAMNFYFIFPNIYLNYFDSLIPQRYLFQPSRHANDDAYARTVIIIGLALHMDSILITFER